VEYNGVLEKHGVRIAESNVTKADQRPRYLDFEEARQLLAEMNVHLSPRQIKRSSDMDARGKRKLPWFIDPIEGRLKIERNTLLRAYFNRQVEAERSYDN
jgi:hypothetical protein